MTKVMLKNLAPIPEISPCTIEQLTPALLTSTTPVVLRGLVNQWPAVQYGLQSNQSLMDYLLSFYQGPQIQLFDLDAKYKGRYFYKDDFSDVNFTKRRTTVEQLFLDIQANNQKTNPDTCYMGSTSVDHIFPKFRQKNDLSAVADAPLVSAWIGNHSTIAAHYDIPDNIACVVAGSRRFTLFPPDQFKNLYIGPIDFTPAGQPASLVDFSNVDEDKFPQFKTALEHGMTAELLPGDAIFIPSMWWHHVQSTSEFNMLVNYWWRQVDISMAAPSDALNHALLAIRDLPKAQREVWRELFDYYIFSAEPPEHIPAKVRGVLNPIDDIQARKLRAMLVNKLNR